MTKDEVIAALQDRNLKMVAERTGIHHNSLLALRNGAVANPNPRTLATLAAYLRPAQGNAQ